MQGTGTSDTKTHDYATEGTYTVSITGALDEITYFLCGESSISGDIGQFSNLTSLTSLNLADASISGDIADINTLTGLIFLNLHATSVSDYTTTTLPDWEGCTIFIHNLGLTTTEVDNFLIDLDNATGAPGNGTLHIEGTNAARSVASDAAKASLIVKNWDITVNE